MNISYEVSTRDQAGYWTPHGTITPAPVPTTYTKKTINFLWLFPISYNVMDDNQHARVESLPHARISAVNIANDLQKTDVCIFELEEWESSDGDYGGQTEKMIWKNGQWLDRTVTRHRRCD